MKQETRDEINKVAAKINALRLDVAEEVADIRDRMDVDGDGDVDVDDLTKWVAANPKKSILAAVVLMVVIALIF